MSDKFQAVVIGGGPGGYVCAIRLAQLGFKTACIESRGSLGGTCLNVGCIPSKSLLNLSEEFHMVKHLNNKGIEIGEVKLNLSKMMKSKDKAVTILTKGVEFLLKKNKVVYFKGVGSFKSKNEILIKDDQNKEKVIQTEKTVIATGSVAASLPGIEIDEKIIVSSTGALNLDKVPKKMVIVGSGAIGVEFAYFYNAMGVDVTVVEFLPNIVPVEDIDVSKQLEKTFKKKGMNIMTNSSVEKVEKSSKGCEVHIKTAKGMETISCDIVLSAVGIQPNIENIGLEETGIVVDGGKIVVNEYYETNIPGYYAIGDVVAGQALAHVASAEGITCVEKIAGQNPEPIDYNNIPGCTYCSPEIASVGMTEKAAKEAGYELKIGKFPFSASGKASAAGHNDGFIKLVFDAKYGELLGGHMIGANVTEMIAEIVALRKLETTGHELIKTVHPHPTMSEAVMEAAAAAYDEVIHI